MSEPSYQVAVLTVSLHIPQSESLKDKRHVLRSIKDRAKNKFNVSVAEIDGQDKWQVAVLAFAMIGNEQKHLNQCMEHLLSLVEGNHQSEICDHLLEFI